LNRGCVLVLRLIAGVLAGIPDIPDGLARATGVPVIARVRDAVLADVVAVEAEVVTREIAF